MQSHLEFLFRFLHSCKSKITRLRYRSHCSAQDKDMARISPYGSMLGHWVICEAEGSKVRVCTAYRAFIVWIPNSAKKRFKGGKKSQTQTKAGGNLLLPQATGAPCASSRGCLYCSLGWESRFLPLAISSLRSEPHSTRLKPR